MQFNKYFLNAYHLLGTVREEQRGGKGKGKDGGQTEQRLMAPILELGFCCPDSISATFELCAAVIAPKFLCVLKYKIETTTIITTVITTTFQEE